MKISSLLFYCLLILFTRCSTKHTHHTSINNSSIEEKIENLKDSNNNQVIVVAHRGDWRNAPENSLQAIQNCIDIGVDMVEIDIRATKDGHLVLMHDTTIDRTTNGKGNVKDWTLESLKNLYLVDGFGVITKHKIPTLKEALLLSKDKILVNLDKSYEIFDTCFEIIKETGTQHQVVIKGAQPLAQVKSEFGNYLDKVHFMPILSLPDTYAEKFVSDYLNSENQPVAIEFIVKTDTISFLKEFKKIRAKGSSIWVNALWADHCAGHDDESAMKDVNVYDWFIKNHVDIIQTDRPQLLLDYLRSRKLHQ